MKYFNYLTAPGFKLELPPEALEMLADSDSNPGVSIQMKDEGYIFANQAVLKLYHINNLNDLLFKKDEFLTSNKKLIKIYSEHYDQVFSTEKVLSTSLNIEPINRQKFVTIYKGKIFPLYINDDKPNALLTIATPVNKTLALNPNQIFDLSINIMQEYLIKKRYLISVNDITIYFSRQEILCFIGLLKGRKAGEIAVELNLKQNTVEAYTKSLKNKCDVSLKSELIDFFISNKILEQIIV